jgi:hypothetical protein
MDRHDKDILRELTEQYLEICHDPVQDRRRDLWRRHNSLERTRPPIYVRAFAWIEMPQNRTECHDPLARGVENALRQSIFRWTFDDDFIHEPWVTIPAARVIPDEGPWGLPVEWINKEYGKAGVWESPIQEPDDLQRLHEPHHAIDEDETARREAAMQEAIGDLIAIEVDRSPIYRIWHGDISTDLAYLRGLEQIMWDVYDRPEWLHELLAFMRDGVLQAQREAEEAGDWRLANHENQAMPYAEELPDPQAGSGPVPRSQLWTFLASQETTAIGPQLFDEFMLQYQIPIMAPFGLSAYGCCEDLSDKIPLLRQIPNLRRIAVSPMADVARCAEQIGTDYVFSYRPSPADMVAYRWDEARIAGILQSDLEACRECHVDITLKDVETVQHDPDRIRRWVALTRRVIDEVF